jgi:hypothetical protein
LGFSAQAEETDAQLDYFENLSASDWAEPG